MIAKIKQIQGIDAFDNLRWEGEDLRTYNLIYGWNGSGKTTIARVLAFLEKREITLTEFESVDFGIQTTTGVLKTPDLKSHSLDLRVFNSDFVNKNVLFDDSTAKPIVMMGEENLGLQREIASLEEEKRAAQKDLDVLKSRCPKAAKHLDILSDAAALVPKQFTNTLFADDLYYGRSYRKPKVDALLENGTITEQNLDSLFIDDQEVLEGKKEIVKQEKSAIEFSLEELKQKRMLFENANSLLKSDVRTDGLKELTEDPKLRAWIEDGYRLHQERNLNICQFCQNQVSKERYEELSRYFTSELKEAKDDLDGLVVTLKVVETGDKVLGIDSGKLYPDLAKEYLGAKQILQTSGDTIGRATQELICRLEKKRDSLTGVQEFPDAVPYPEADARAFNEAVATIKALLAKHNERVQNREKESHDAAKSIELHTVAGVLKAKEYFLHKNEYEEAEANKNGLIGRIEGLTQNIKLKRGMMKNTAIAAQKINDIARKYFGEGQIYLENDDSGGENGGYVLKRRNKAAKHLSEGEKSVLALIYFFVKLEEEGCAKTSCVVVVDDPVDSQDVRYLFQTYGLLKWQLMHAKQLILFTHNYEFFNLIRDWLISKPYRDNSRLYLVSINKSGATRELVVEDLPELLRKYKSEYQYLFSLLYRYARGEGNLEEPLVANIARKVLEYFAGFKWVCKTEEEFTNIMLTRYANEDNVYKRGICDFVLKFVNEYSHGQEFSRPTSATMLEAKKIAENTLEFIKHADSDHYSRLKEIATE